MNCIPVLAYEQGVEACDSTNFGAYGREAEGNHVKSYLREVQKELVHKMIHKIRNHRNPKKDTEMLN
jgi:hypothetical protein